MTDGLKGPHLKLAARVPLQVGHYVTLHEGFAYVADPYGSARYIHIVDVRQPSECRLVKTLTFTHAIPFVVARGQTLIAGERHRGLHVIDISRPEEAKVVDCVPLLGRIPEGIVVQGNRAVVSLDDTDSIAVIDLERTFQLQPLQEVKQKGLSDQVLLCDGRILFCAREDGLVEGTLQAEGFEIQQRYPLEGFQGSRIFAGASRLFIHGRSKSKEGPDFLVLNRKDPSQVLARVSLKQTPSCVLELEGGGALVMHSNYTCTYVDESTGIARPFLKFYEERAGRTYIEAGVELTEDEDGSPSENVLYPEGHRDLSCMNDMHWAVRQGGHLFSVHGDELNAWEIQPGSVFERIEGPSGDGH